MKLDPIVATAITTIANARARRKRARVTVARGVAAQPRVHLQEHFRLRGNYRIRLRGVAVLGKQEHFRRRGNRIRLRARTRTSEVLFRWK